MNAEKITTDELAPGNACPVCDERIVTWISTEARNPEFGKDDDGNCTVPAENVEVTGLMSGITGNVVIIDHKGPSME